MQVPAVPDCISLKQHPVKKKVGGRGGGGGEAPARLSMMLMVFHELIKVM